MNSAIINSVGDIEINVKELTDEALIHIGSLCIKEEDRRIFMMEVCNGKKASSITERIDNIIHMDELRQEANEFRRLKDDIISELRIRLT